VKVNEKVKYFPVQITVISRKVIATQSYITVIDIPTFL